MENSSYLPSYEDGRDRVFRNVSIKISEVRELPRRKHRTIRTRRKFEITLKPVTKLSTDLYSPTDTRHGALGKTVQPGSKQQK